MDPELYYGIVKLLATGNILNTIDQETQRIIKKTSDLYILDKNTLYK